MEKRLCRNEHDKVLAGVSSGLADYLAIDVTLVRILFALAAVFSVGAFFLVYVVLWIVLPVNNNPVARFSKFNEFYQHTPPGDPMFNSPNAFNNPSNSGTQTKWNTQNVNQDFGNQEFNAFPKNNDTGRTVAGLVLIILGVYFLLKKFIFIPVWFSLGKLWPLIIVAIGIALIFKNKRKNEWEAFKKATEESQPSSEKETAAEPQENTNTPPQV
ncbi:phage shock protein C [compost metagenome]